jgi:hypothetical protein
MATVDQVKKNIAKIYEQRKIKLYALALSYAGQAINKARAEKSWTDRTSQAVERMFSKAFIDKDEIGFFLSHGVIYGIYLELSNDRKYEIIRPVIQELAPKFFEDAKRII